MSAVDAPGKQYSLALAKRTNFTTESPTMAMDGAGGVGARAGMFTGLGWELSLEVECCAATWVVVDTGGAPLTMEEGSTAGREEIERAVCRATAAFNSFRRVEVEHEPGSMGNSVRPWGGGRESCVIKLEYLLVVVSMGEGGRARTLPRPRPAVLHGNGVELLGGGGMGLSRLEVVGSSPGASMDVVTVPSSSRGAETGRLGTSGASPVASKQAGTVSSYTAPGGAGVPPMETSELSDPGQTTEAVAAGPT